MLQETGGGKKVPVLPWVCCLDSAQIDTNRKRGKGITLHKELGALESRGGGVESGLGLSAETSKKNKPNALFSIYFDKIISS